MGDQEEIRVRVGFFDDLEEFVGGLGRHAFGEPDDGVFVTALVGADGHFADDFLGFVDRDGAGFFFEAQVFAQGFFREIRVVQHQLAPGSDEGLAQRAASAFGNGIHREDEMEVRVNEFVELLAIGTCSAGLAVVALLAGEVLCQGNSVCNGSVFTGFGKQNGMPGAIFIAHGRQLLFEGFIAPDFSE